MEMNTSVLKTKAKPQAEIEKEMEQAAKQLKNSKMVELFVPEVYRGVFGDPLEFSVNGVTIEVPIGEKVNVPEAHYKHAQRLMKGAVVSKTQRRLTPAEVFED